MICKILLDLFLAASWWSGFGMDLDRPVADAYYPCASTVCDCPKDSPCKKDCCKDACTCKGGVCPANGPIAVCGMPAVCQMPGIPIPAFNPVAPPRLYQVHLTLGKGECPKLVLPAGHVANLVTATDDGKVQHFRVKLGEDRNDCLPIQVCQQSVEGCGGCLVPCMSHQGEKSVPLNTPTNIVLSNPDDPEPRSVQVRVMVVDPRFGITTAHPQAMVMPCCPPMAPVPCAPPMPPIVAMPPMPCLAPSFMCRPCPPPQPMAYVPPMNCPPQMPCMSYPATPPMPAVVESRMRLPEPLPLPRPTVPTACDSSIARCVSVTPAKKDGSSARVEFMRQNYPTDKSMLTVSCDSLSATVVRMTICKGECGSLTVAAGKKCVHIKGKNWKAQADSIEMMPDGRVMLNGHVKLMCDKLGVCASVKAEKMCIRIKDSKLETIGAESLMP